LNKALRRILAKWHASLGTTMIELCSSTVAHVSVGKLTYRSHSSAFT
jgi:hypothetical protein